MSMSQQHVFYSIVIAAGLSVLISTSCSNLDSQTQPADTSPADSVQPPGDRYVNPEYDLALRLPASWIVVEEPLRGRTHEAINLIKKGTGAKQETPLHVHAEADHSYIAILPGGWGTELPNSQYAPFSQAEEKPELSFEIDTSKSKVLHLKDGSPWAYFIAPADPPGKWTDSGFIFAQIQTRQDTTYCIDAETGERQAVRKCDYSRGDQYIRKGNRNEQEAAVIHEILGSFFFVEGGEKKPAGEMIKIENPEPEAKISSPLPIKGVAKGYWYFEGTFTVKLYDDVTDSLVAQSSAEADGEWMTEQFVPFKATMTFKAPENHRGRLVFERANPSGLPENAQSYSVPVIFSSR